MAVRTASTVARPIPEIDQCLLKQKSKQDAYSETKSSWSTIESRNIVDMNNFRDEVLAPEKEVCGAVPRHPGVGWCNVLPCDCLLIWHVVCRCWSNYLFVAFANGTLRRRKVAMGS